MARQESNAWTPESLAVTPTYWCGDRYDSTYDGDWLPLKGTGYFYQLTSGSRPTNATKINGHQALTFDGTKHVTGTQSAINLSGCTTWLVIQPTSIGTNQMVWCWDSGINLRNVCMINTSGQLVVGAFSTTFAPFFPTSKITYETPLQAGSTYAIISVFTDTHHYLYVNGELVGSVAYANTTPSIFVGETYSIKLASYSGNTSFVGTLGNYGFCNYAVQGTELQSLRTYLNEWAGIKWSSGKRTHGLPYLTRTPTQIYGSSLGSHWGDNVAGSTWTDETGAANMTRWYGVTPVGTFSGSGAKYVQFNGNACYSAGDVSYVDGLTEITLFACYNMDNVLTEPYGVILGKLFTPSAFHLGLSNTQVKIVASIGTAIDFDFAATNGNKTMPINSWHTAVFNWKASTGGVLYIDGVAQATTMPVDAAYSQVPANSEELCIGGCKGAGDFGSLDLPIQGYLSHVGIVKRSSTADEVQYLTRFLQYQVGI